jgi:hypothetical protein
MELIIKVRNDKASYLAQILEKIDYVEDVEIKYEKAEKSDISEEQFLQNLRYAVSDAEDPEEAYQGVLQGLKEVELYQQGKIKLQSAREMLDELKKELENESDYK